MRENSVPSTSAGAAGTAVSGPPRIGPSPMTIIALFAFVVVAWGLTWVAMKVVVREVSPVWAVALRSWIAVAVLLPAVGVSRQFILPPRQDLPVVLVISLCHMSAFAVLMTAGLQYVSAGRTIVLGYTTPLWVAPAAWLFLREAMPWRRIVGIAIGLAGLLLLFDPRGFDWNDDHALLGNGFILAAALCWSASIVYTRAHRWQATPFQLALWQFLLAAVVLTFVASALEGRPNLSLSSPALLSLLYNGAVGTALGFLAVTALGRSLPALVVSLGLLATPAIGLILSALILGEGLDATLVISSLLILTGIAIGTIGTASSRA